MPHSIPLMGEVDAVLEFADGSQFAAGGFQLTNVNRSEGIFRPLDSFPDVPADASYQLRYGAQVIPVLAVRKSAAGERWYSVKFRTL